MVEPVICPLWVSNDGRFRSRHYHAWDRPCALCRRKVVVSDAIKRQLESNSGTVIVCEQCALARLSEVDALHSHESEAVDPEETCSDWPSWNVQYKAAAMGLAGANGLSVT